jgi:hypothetical protein
MDRKVSPREKESGKHEAGTKLMHDHNSQAFAEGREAAREAFGTMRNLLIREKDKRKPRPER